MTAIGDVIPDSNVKRSICLLTGAIATNAAPTDGNTMAATSVPMYPVRPNFLDGVDYGAGFQGRAPDFSTLVVSSTAGSGALSVTLTLWGYLNASAKWYPITVNAAAAITGTGTIRFAQQFQQLGHWDRLYLNATAISGTSLAVEAWLVTAKPGQ